MTFWLLSKTVTLIEVSCIFVKAIKMKNTKYIYYDIITAFIYLLFLIPIAYYLVWYIQS